VIGVGLQALRVDQPDERCEGGGAELEFARIHFIDTVDRSVMIIKIPLRIRPYLGDGHALQHERSDVGSG
jgi:hypothetical protein